MQEHRVRTLNSTPVCDGTIVYWMSRDQRAADNWAFLHAQGLALRTHSSLVVLFCLTPDFADASFEQLDFMLRGLQEVEEDMRRFGIPFILRIGSSDRIVASVVKEFRAGAVVTDFSPLRHDRMQKRTAALQLPVAMFEVDTHNIVPVWHASPKLEFGAYTLRPKLLKLLPEFLEDIPPAMPHPFSLKERLPQADWDSAYAALGLHRSHAHAVRESGAGAARAVLDEFVNHRLEAYGGDRNDPTLDAQSHLSPYLHFGQIAAQRVALEVKRTSPSPSADDFLEELIVRRELSDNFCFYNDRYDAFEGFPSWAQLSLNLHRTDARSHTYTLERFESAETHDPLWNAAQRELLSTGRMHGYMRMYWAKKILEWTASPEEAIAIALHLNDAYQLDGRDANGYAGVAWSIGGVHDRAWFERPVFGKIRYMNANGCARKFNVKEYCRKFA